MTSSAPPIEVSRGTRRKWVEQPHLRQTEEVGAQPGHRLLGGLEQVPGYQNVPSPYDTLWWSQAKLHYSNVRSSLGHVDDEKGHTWELVAANNYVNGKAIPLIRGAFDIGFSPPIRHSSIWLRTDAGYAHGDADDPFAFFFFGGFGNNYVDDGTIKRYHEWYSLPGVDLNAIGGQTFTRRCSSGISHPFDFVAWGGRVSSSPGFARRCSPPAS